MRRPWPLLAFLMILVGCVTEPTGERRPDDVRLRVTSSGGETTDVMELLWLPLPVLLVAVSVIFQETPGGGPLYPIVYRADLLPDQIGTIEALIDTLDLASIEAESVTSGDFGVPDGPTVTVTYFDADGPHSLAA